MIPIYIYDDDYCRINNIAVEDYVDKYLFGNDGLFPDDFSFADIIHMLIAYYNMMERQ